MSANADLDAALVAYLGHATSPFPTLDPDNVLARCGADGEWLLRECQALVDESMTITIDWDSTSLGDAGREVARVMGERHPDLGERALDALAWNFTYSMR